MNEQQYAEYLLREMTIDFTMDFHCTKECALKCCDEMIYVATDSDTIKYLRKVKSIIESK